MRKQLPLPPQARWASAMTAGLFAATATCFWWHDVSIWLGFTIALVGATITDMIWVAREIVPLPHIVILIASLQYGLAPWASNLYPSIYPDYQIIDLQVYFAYAGPVLAAITMGFLASGVGLRLKSSRAERPGATRQLLQELDILLWGGMAADFLASGTGGNLAFVVVLLGALRFVGVIGWMIVEAQGWKWRLGALLLYEVYVAAHIGMFHDLILWGLSLLAIFVFLHRVKRLAFIGALAFLVSGVFFLQDAKWTLRAGIWDEGGEVVIFGKPRIFTGWTRPFEVPLCLIDSASKLFTGGYTDESVGNSVTRFNQGWIIDHVMRHVPSEEPYARGETLWAALQASLLPRVLAPDKLIVNGRVNMERFAGHAMTGDTSMNIGFAGEMYANFGLWGGVAGCGFYALVLGLFFRWAAVLAQRSPFWWAIAVYCGHWAFKAETDIGGVMNYVVKAAFLAFLVTLCMPSLRAELTGNGLKIGNRKSRLRIARSELSVGSPLEPVPVASSAAKNEIDTADDTIEHTDA